MSSLLCALDPAAAESRSKKQLGSESRSILGDTSQWMKVSLFYFIPIKTLGKNCHQGFLPLISLWRNDNFSLLCKLLVNDTLWLWFCNFFFLEI